MKRGIELGLAACAACELVVRVTDPVEGGCPRCGVRIHRRKPRARTRAWALLVAAAVLYVPANLLVMMNTEQFPDHRADTIFSGIAYLWTKGSWDLAVVVFLASILIPLVKFLSLGTLLVTTAEHTRWRLRGRTKLYRVLEVIGHWSMLDVFVVALLTAVVQLGRFANVEPGPAILPFAGVVVTTMLAASAFDPREMWDEAPP